MHQVMVVTAQRHPVVDVGFTVVFAPVDVMNLSDPTPAASNGANVTVAESDGTALFSVEQPLIAAQIEDLRLALYDYPMDAGIAEQPMDRLRSKSAFLG